MRELTIYGGKPLAGQLRVQGSKNAVLPILAATLLTDEPCEIRNCPDLTDVHAALDILKSLGCRADYDGHTAVIHPSGAQGTAIPDDLMRRMRSSVMFLGAVLGRCRKACISYPGGCELGARPIDIHLRALRSLGVRLLEEGGYIHCCLEQFVPRTITFMFPSVGATENIMMLCAVSEGETILVNPAREPEIVDLQNFLNCMGADIVGAGTDCIRIRGVTRLHGCSYAVIPDRIAAATYACAAAACGGEILLTGVEPVHMRILLSVLRDMGAEITEEGEQIWMRMHRRPLAVSSVKTLPYPGFPTDDQAPLMAALLKAEGSSVISETIFENRFKHVGEFLRMGANIQIEGLNAIVRGVDRLHGAEVNAADLRGGAALVIAGLSAEGKTVVRQTCYIDRGYEDIAGAFQSLGGNICYQE
ncbi:UDP-N-acetylglucosamine 1-carboxyvinyltransferase [Ructibacterium gallinarum]|uniref:UDP-N-acetylglucosamine 1-carboxyvinyltransferase n=1 Tax=Ructibacterium gallinarum TaxID=2779355 RepID=A0A9D5LXW7_9FIRM|nr:UDP-N-acetylglucosamine 1-carboxyvinyltransferase [Ructibacterium gallinarum]MBE5039963.1 UDP-N-acetylglucosamine 1-carboxyvinyltransferase [Ructibacterium gallinarum]